LGKEMIGELQNHLFKTYSLVGGVDEVGRGPLAGPVVACTVVFDRSVAIEGLRDSKKLSPKKRAQLKVEIFSKALGVSVAFVDENEIDRVNIYHASRQAMTVSVETLQVRPDFLITDAMQLPLVSIPHEALVKADSKEPCVMAASIVAKEARDEYMRCLGESNPGYGFERHMGYGTRQHLQALSEIGVLSCHRRSFRPVMKALLQNESQLRSELSDLEAPEIIAFVKRARQMGLQKELSQVVKTVNAYL
jgi:ribonuclease HII